jgi:hypothetical protein
MLRLTDSRVIATDTTTRRKLASSVRRIGERVGVFLFGAADTHIHVGTLGDRKTAGIAAGRISASIGRAVQLPVRFAPSTVKKITDQRHLVNVVGYVLRQEQHHGTNADPFHEASCLPDVLGMRIGAPWLRSRLLGVAPRLDPMELAHNLPRLSPAKAVTAEALPLLGDAAAAAICEPTLSGRKPSITHARAAAIRVALELDLGTLSAISSALGIDRATTWRLRRASIDDELKDAIELQLRMRISRAEDRHVA